MQRSESGAGPTGREITLERCAIALAAALFLWFFRTVIYSGDALVYTAHIDANLLVWNPNHLFMDPVAYGWCHLLWSFGLDISPIDALKIISGGATLVTLILFHAVLLQAGVNHRVIRLLAVAGLFASRNFLSMAVSEEFFMLEMPFLVLALWMLLKLPVLDDAGQRRWAMIIGAVLGLATAISINHIVLGVAVAAYLLLLGATSRQKLSLAGLFGAAATAVCLPLFVLGYSLSDAQDGFVQWLVAYQGSTDNPLASLYGLSLTPKGIATSLARLALNTFTNLMGVGSLGTVMKSLVFGSPLEMTVQPSRVAIGVLLLLGIIATLALLAWWVLRNWRQRVVQLGLIWMASFYVFNFFWDDSSDQFWFQILPIVWLFFALFASEPAAVAAPANASPQRFRFALMVLLVPVLWVFNTAQEVVPRSFVDLPGLAAEHGRLLRDGDFEVFPGWDDIRWIQRAGGDIDVTQFSLMQAALNAKRDPRVLEKLAARIEAHLRSGRRVIVARLYDLDREARPWDQLRKLGWSRDQVQKEFARFDSRPIGTVDGVVFRELSLRASGG